MIEPLKSNNMLKKKNLLQGQESGGHKVMEFTHICPKMAGGYPKKEVHSPIILDSLSRSLYSLADIGKIILKVI
jgi:hypothetical protein